MRLKLTTLLLALLLLSSASQAKEVISLNGYWQFALGPSVDNIKITDYPDTESIERVFQEVTVPHTWHTCIVERVNNGEAFHLGKGWYKRVFNAPKDFETKRTFIRFEAVGMESIVRLNGEFVGEHIGAHAAFCYEITDLLVAGENLLEVEVCNLANRDMIPAEAVLESRFAGIYRPVTLLVAEQSCISPLDFGSPGIYLTPTNVSEKRSNLEIRVATSSTKAVSPAKLTAVIRDMDGKVVKSLQRKVNIDEGESIVSLNTIVDKPHLWDGVRDPYLYSAEVALYDGNGDLLDSGVEPLGFRYFEFDPKRGLILNGKHYDLYGASRKQDWEVEGVAITPEMEEVDIDLLMELGSTGTRFGHYQQSDNICRLTDERGLISFAEISLTPPDSKSEAFHQNCRQQLEELIKQLYNHPSILVWNLLNEVFPTTERLRDLNRLAHSLDQTRLTSVVYNRTIPEEEREWYNTCDMVCSNKYPWWYGNQGDDLGNAGIFSERYEQICSVREDLIFGITEYGAGGCINQHCQNPTCPDTQYGRFFPEEYQNEVHEKQWAQLQGHDEYWCKLIWNLTDFSWSAARRGEFIGRNHKGLVTHDRKTRKDVFFFYRALWNSEMPTLYITSRRHTERDEAVTPVKIYSNCKSVELFVNGISQGKINDAENCTFRWDDIKLSRGANKIVVKGRYQGKRQEDSCEWVLE